MALLSLRSVAIAYHGVNTVAPSDDPNDLVMPPEHLEAQVRLLQRLGYELVTADELVARHGAARRPPRGVAVLTFDDGWRDALTVTGPLLERLGVRATFYVNPGRWGGEHHDVAGPAARLLTADEAGALAASGMDVAAHSLDHDDLRTLDDAALTADMRGAKAAVEDVTGRPCRTLAYPFGAHDERVRRATAAAGYDLAWAWIPGPWDPFAAPRLPAPTRDGAGKLALKLAGVRKPRRIGPPPSAAAPVA